MASARLAARVCLVAVLAAACGAANPQQEGAAGRNPAAVVDGQAYRPSIDPEGFVEVVDNPYLPLRPGQRRVYEGHADGERERVVVTVTSQTREVIGVTATVVRDRAFVAGELVEDTFDWFAQDREGNVWYFGEETAEYEDGKVANRAGSWEAGVDGAQPGIVMLAEPRVGDSYRQEFYAGEAEDMGRVRSLDASVTVPSGSFDHVLVTEDWTPLEPDVLEHKFYASGVGVVLERLVRGGEGVLRLVEGAGG
jgi:hypothetical protein